MSYARIAALGECIFFSATEAVVGVVARDDRALPGDRLGGVQPRPLTGSARGGRQRVAGDGGVFHRQLDGRAGQIDAVPDAPTLRGCSGAVSGAVVADNALT